MPLLEALAGDGHVVFSRIFEAAEVPLNATDRYTVFVPEDGEAVKPGDATGVAGGSGILGLFSAYAIDTRTAASIRSSPVFDQVKGACPRRSRAHACRPHSPAWWCSDLAHSDIAQQAAVSAHHVSAVAAGCGCLCARSVRVGRRRRACMLAAR